MVFYDSDDPGSGGDPGTGNPANEPQHWLDTNPDYADLAKDPDAREHFSKYKTQADQLKSHAELQKQYRKEFRVPNSLEDMKPEEVTKITDRLKGILKPEHLRDLSGVPEKPEGYEFKVPEGNDKIVVDEQGLTDFRAFCHEKQVPQVLAQELFDLQHALVARTSTERAEAQEKLLTKRTDENYKEYLETDCDGDKDLAATQMELVKTYLQSTFVKKDGTRDTKGWEQFVKEIYHNDRMIQLPLMRALAPAAQMYAGTGGSGRSTGGIGGTDKIDVNKRWPKSGHIMEDQ